MAYTDDYVKTNWVNKPSTNTPLNQTNLNHAEQGIKNNCGRVANLSTTKAEQSDLLTVFKNVSFDSATGTFTFTRFNDTVVTINTDLEKIAVNFDYDDNPNSPHYQNLIITLADGTVKYADLSALITQYEFTDTATIDITVSAGGTISASVIDGSITASKLQPNYLADVTAQASIATNGANTATSQALVSEGWAKGTQNGTPVASGSPYYENNAEYFKNQAQQIAGSSLGGLSDVTIITPTNGQVLTYDADNNIWRNSDGGSVDTKSGNPLSLTTDSAQVARSTTITLNPIQAAGTPTPANPIPIYGYDKVEARVTGRNFLNLDEALITWGATYSKNSNTYTITLNGSMWATPFKFSESNVEVTLSGTITNGTSVACVAQILNANGNVVAQLSEGSSSTTGTGCQIRFGFSTIGNFTFANPQLELGSTKTAYEPYTEATNISLPLPETVYGGELDVESGVMTVTHGKVVANGDATLSYGKNSGVSGDTDYLYYVYSGSVAIAHTLTNQNGVKSNLVPTDGISGAADHPTVALSNSDNRIIYINLGNILGTNDLASFKTYLSSNPITIVYELATPYEIQLTPHQVRLLEGANVITSNGTTITVMYREGKIASLADLEGMAKTINEVADIANGDKSASQITAGTLKGQVNANTTAMANLGTAQVRNIIVTDTAPTVGSSTTIPDGTLIIVYE